VQQCRRPDSGGLQEGHSKSVVAAAGHSAAVVTAVCAALCAAA
jgi:hypothetical protein